MPTITLVEFNGREHTIEAEPGLGLLLRGPVAIKATFLKNRQDFRLEVDLVAAVSLGSSEGNE